MASIDNLEIEIKANSSKAVKQLNNLTKSIESLSVALSGSGSQNIIKFTDNLVKLGQSAAQLKGVNTLTKNLEKLSNATKNIDTSKFASLTSTINSLGHSLENVDISAASRFTSSIARLASAGEKTGQSAAGLPLLQKNLINFMKAMSGVKKIDGEVNTLISSIARLASAGKNAEKTAAALPELAQRTREYIATLSTAPTVNENTVRLIAALGQLASAGSKANSVLNNLAGGSRRTALSFNFLKGSMLGVAGVGATLIKETFTPQIVSMSKIASQIGVLTGKYWMLIAGVKKLGSSIGSSMDFIETLNYYDNALDTLKNNANEDFKEMGYENADAYYESFRKRSDETLAKMSGFELTDGGNLKMTGLQNLGVDPNQLMNYQSVFTQMATSLGLATTNASKLGKILPEIGADMASLYNKEFTDVWDDLQSGITGMARTWDKYGTNIRVANMEQYAATHGLNVNVQTMSQADKVLLRTIILLDSQRSAWADLATTINQPRNQLRMLQNSFNNLARAIGSIFLPIVAAILPYLNALMIVLTRAAQAIANFMAAVFHFKPRDLTGKVAVDNAGISDLADETDNYTGKAKKAAKATKEWKNQLMGFDEINKLEDQGDKGGNGGGSGSPGGGASGLQDAFDSIYEEYQKAWDKAFNSMENDAQRMAKKMENALKMAWAKTDGSIIGLGIAKGINKAISWVEKHSDKWDKGLKKVAKILASSLNSAIANTNFSKLGSTLGKTIKSKIEAETTFFKNVKWKNLGKSLSRSLNAFIRTGVLESIAENLATKFKAIIDTAFGAVKKFNFKSLGTHIGDSIKTFFNEMNTVDSRGLTGWEKLGKTITTSVKGFGTTITTAFKGVDWKEVGRSVALGLEQIKWGEILKSVADTVVTTFASLFTASWNASPALTSLISIGLGIAKIPKAIAQFEKIKNVGTTIQTIFNVIKPFLKFLAKNPYVAIATGIGALILALKNFGKVKPTIKLTTDLAQTEKDLQAVRSALGETKNAIENFNESQSDIDAEWSYIGDIADEYYNLSKKVKRTNEEQAIMESYADILTDKIPELKDKIDKQTKAYKGTYDALTDLVKKTETYYKLQAAQEDLLSIGKGLYKVEKKIATAETDLSKNRKKLNELTAKKKAIDEDENSVLKVSAKEYDKLQADILQYQNKVDSSTKSLNKAKGEQKKLNDEYNYAKNYVNNLSTSYSTLSSKTDKAAGSAKNANKELNNIPSNKTIKINSQYDAAAYAKAKKDVNSLPKEKNVKLTTSYPEKQSKKVDTLKSDVDNVPSEKTVKFKISKPTGVADAAKKAAATFAKNFKLNWTMNMKGKKIEVKTEPNGYSYARAKKKANGGVFKNGRWQNITRYAAGGLPNQGQMFIAREAGAELVGRLGNSTAVMNNDQIVSSVAKGVQGAVEAAMRNAMNSGSNSTQFLQADISIDGRKVMESMLAQARTISNQTNGKNVFMTL